MRNFITCIVVVVLVAIAGILYVTVKNVNIGKVLTGGEPEDPMPMLENRVAANDKIAIDNVRIGQTISSPITITGKARGPWFFEASFPVKLLDSTGKTLLITHAQALSEWMTEDFVPFSVTLNFDSPEIGEGFLIFQKDNPSGLPEFDESLEVPIKFH